MTHCRSRASYSVRRFLLAAAAAGAMAAAGCGGGAEEDPTAKARGKAVRPLATTSPTTSTMPDPNSDDPSNFLHLPEAGSKDIVDIGGVKHQTWPDGLLSRDISPGDGVVPVEGQTVDIRYTIRRADTQEELLSIVHDKKVPPLMLIFGQKRRVPAFWHEGVAGMKKGGKRLLMLPPALAAEALPVGPGGTPLPPGVGVEIEIELTDIRGDSLATRKLAAEAAAIAATQPASTQSGAATQAAPVTLADGLITQDLVIGNGAAAEAGKTVSVHYTGRLTDGTVFDSSVTRGQPFGFTIGAGEVIRGWDLGVAGMKVGGKRKLTVPPGLGYGARATGKIPPNSTLHFDVELLNVE